MLLQGMIEEYISRKEISLFYNYYKLDFNFNENDLKNEKITENAWMHYSCGYWSNLIFKDKNFCGFEILKKSFVLNRKC